MEGALLIVSAEVLSGKDDEFNEWYDKHHIPLYSSKMPLLKSVKRFYSKNSVPRYITIYEYASYDDMKKSINSEESKLAGEDADRQVGVLVKNFTYGMYSEAYRNV